MPTITPIANYHCKCGENPLWDDRTGHIWWVDIPNGRLFRADPVAGHHELFFQGETIGGFTFQEDGSLLLFEANRMARLEPSGKRTVLKEDICPRMQRFNDVMADPLGRVYAGTIGQDKTSGGLYRVERDGSVTQLFLGSGCANGMGFTPDMKRLYWTCSTRRKIYLFDYDRASGALSNEQVFYAAPEGEGTPDGMTVDTQGNVWTARWDGHAVLKLSPQAKVLEKVEFPVAKVSSCCWGGAGLDELFVTTAGGKDGSETADGTLFRVSGLDGAKGTKEFRSGIML